MLPTIRLFSNRSCLLRRFLCSSGQSLTSDNQKIDQQTASPPSPPPPPSYPEKAIVGTFQPIPRDVYERLFSVNGFEPFSSDLFEVLDDKSIMVRQPYLQILDYIERTDFNRPVNRYVICKYL